MRTQKPRAHCRLSSPDGWQRPGSLWGPADSGVEPGLVGLLLKAGPAGPGGGFNGIMKHYHTQRLSLVHLHPDDCSLLADFELRNRDFFRPWEPARSDEYFSPEAAALRISAENRNLEEGREFTLYLRFNGGEKIIGRVSLSGIIMGPFKSAFLGYKLDEHETGQGLMSEALERLMHAAGSELGLHRVQANIMPRNKASLKCIRNLGFRCEGMGRDYLRINGRWEDHLFYTRLFDEK